MREEAISELREMAEIRGREAEKRGLYERKKKKKKTSLLWKRLRFAFAVFVGERESQTEEVVEGSIYRGRSD
ncbi:hypothetical protein DY000_02009476 [Brassica cretica]|uniref:Uncharacterized protein n=1 Tax=Brassica cretica TaxID=69181 RepID=A0ABQ7C3K3_BRACR|nr:hypothetical protein DY000_02009476 [Brassica cretica]